MEREERAAFMIFRNNFKIDIEQIHHLIMLSENLRFEDDKGDLRSVQHDLGATPCGLIRKSLFDQETLRVRSGFGRSSVPKIWAQK